MDKKNYEHFSIGRQQYNFLDELSEDPIYITLTKAFGLAIISMGKQNIEFIKGLIRKQLILVENVKVAKHIPDSFVKSLIKKNARIRINPDTIPFLKILKNWFEKNPSYDWYSIGKVQWATIQNIYEETIDYIPISKAFGIALLSKTRRDFIKSLIWRKFIIVKTIKPNQGITDLLVQKIINLDLHFCINPDIILFLKILKRWFL
jgi:hypothetical protein